MSDYHDAERPQDIHTARFPTLDEQQHFIESYVSHALESFDDMDKIENEIRTIQRQTTIWRAAVHAGWTLWGIISATVTDQSTANSILNEDDEAFTDLEPEEESLETGDFDYLDYARQKAALFWGEMQTLGIIDIDEWKQAKIEYIKDEVKFVGR